MAMQPQAPKAPDTTQAPQAPTYRYVDLPELQETFSDSIASTFFDGQSLRIEFCVNRIDPLVPNQAPTGRRYPSCRLVLTPGAALELMNRMQQISAAMIKAGVLKPSVPTPTVTN